MGVHGGVRGKVTNVDSWRGDRKVVREDRMDGRKWRGEGVWNRGRTRRINRRRERGERGVCWCGVVVIGIDRMNGLKTGTNLPSTNAPVMVKTVDIGCSGVDTPALTT